jgi:hypothetical protein
VSWQNRYLLPWDRLHLDRIEAAAAHVLSVLPIRRYEVVAHGTNRVSVYFRFEASLERKRNPHQAGRLFELYEIRDTDEGLVDIGFYHDPADARDGTPAETYFEFYSNISGNSVFSDVGIEIAERIGRFFGVKCEPM